MNFEDLKVGMRLINDSGEKVEVTAVGKQRFLFKRLEDYDSYEGVDGYEYMDSYSMLTEVSLSHLEKAMNVPGLSTKIKNEIIENLGFKI